MEVTMSNKFDDYDYELQQRTADNNVRFTVSFKTILFHVNRIVDETRDVDEHHPKDDLITLWLGCVICFLVLAIFSRSLFLIATLPFIGFYGYVFFRIAKAFKFFHYSMVKFWLFSILALVIIVFIAFCLQQMIFDGKSFSQLFSF